MTLNALEQNLVESAATQTTAFISYGGKWREVEPKKFIEGSRGEPLVLTRCIRSNHWRSFKIAEIAEVICTDRIQNDTTA